MAEEIIYSTQCELCETHKTDVGTLKGLEETVKTNFPDWAFDKQCDLVINWFEKTWKEEMGLRIERSKKEASERIQQYKKQNIQAIKKE